MLAAAAFWAHVQVMNSKPITLSPEAAAQVASFCDQAGEGALRLGVKGGGCSGFQYVLSLCHQQPDDHLFESEGQQVLVSSEALPYVAGSRIVWRQEMMQSGFDVENPNAKSACGCGSSFRLDEQLGCDSQSAL